MRKLNVPIESGEALRKLVDEQISKGRIWLSGTHDVAEREACELVLELEGQAHSVLAEVVFIRAGEPGAGVGLQVTRMSEAQTGALRGFVDAIAGPAMVVPEEEAEVPTEAEPSVEDTEGAPDDPDARAAEGAETPMSLQGRIAALSPAARMRLAASGHYSERIALERLYGAAVWETLLHNPRITPPEVAIIARKGTLPRPLVEHIATNKSWLAIGEVQRALLANARSTQPVILKVLRAMPRADLRLVPTQTAYPLTVKQLAKGLLGR